MKMLRIFLLMISYFLISNHIVFSQENVRIHRSEFKIKDDGFKEAWKSVRKGNKNYRFGTSTYRFINEAWFGTETYRFAREFYLKAYKYNDKNAELNYKIGVCYLYSDDKFLAIKYLKKAFELNSTVTDDIHLQLAKAYHMSLDFANAEKEYSLFKSSISERKLRKLNLNIDKCLEECETGKSLVSRPQRIVAQDLGRLINSEYDDYYPVIDSKEETMYFTSRRPGQSNTKRNYYDKKFSEDIYMVKKRSKEWGIAQLLSRKLTTKRSEAALALSSNDSTLYIYKSKRNFDLELFIIKV